MMFLLRVAFWLSVVILLLPTGGGENPPGPRIGASDAVSAASAAVSDMRQFCTRQPEACAIGTQAAIAFGHKAQAGARMLYEFLSEKLAPTITGSVPAKNPNQPAGPPSQHTLTPADLTPAWRGPDPRKDPPAKRPV